MKDNTFNPSEDFFLENIHEFFGTRTANNHLLFIEHWMELILGGQPQKRWTRPGDLYYFYEALIELFENCNQLLQSAVALNRIEVAATVKLDFLALEKQVLTYYPYQLKEQELLNPIKSIKAVFRKNDLAFYIRTLKIWLAEGLNNNYSSENGDCIIPLYGNVKKMIAACWLIHERVYSKNSYDSPTYHNSLVNFALTDPSLFEQEEANDPFSKIEAFFNHHNLVDYRCLIKKWHIAVLSKELIYEELKDLFFIYNQYLMLIQAGYLITVNDLSYQPRLPKADPYQKLIKQRNYYLINGALTLGDEEPRYLTVTEMTAPLNYCKATLTHENVIKLRSALKEWLNAVFCKQCHVYSIISEDAHSLYLTLQKLTEAFYLTITTANQKD